MCFNPVRPGVFRESAGLGGGIFHPPFWLSFRNFLLGRAKSIVKQISFVMLIFYCFVPNFGGGKSLRGAKGWRLPAHLWTVEKSQH